MFKTLTKYKPDMSEEGIYIQKHLIPAGTIYSLHWHEYLEFEMILSGEVMHMYNNHTYKLGTGDAYLMYYRDFHEITALTDVTVYSLHFRSDMLSPQLAGFLDYNRFHCHLNTKERKHIQHLLDMLKQEHQDKKYGYHLLLKQYINEILIILIRKSAIASDSTTPLPIQQAVSYLNEHFMEQITLRDLARRSALSPNYLGQLFRQQMNCTFREYLNLLRLKCACQLLDTSELSVKEIAFASGYQSVEYFLEVFHKNMQMTPTQYRKKL